jgi:hypothetical protein
VAEPEAAGRFDYLWADAAPEAAGEPDSGAEVEADSFDAFDSSTWNFKPAPVPWYRTRGAAVALAAAAVATAAIVVSLVLLAVRNPSPTGDRVPTSVTPTASSSLAPPPPPLRAGVPPAPPPSPPPPSPTEVEPQSPVYRPTYQQTPTKRPEINVTRTPYSVAPQPRHTH